MASPAFPVPDLLSADPAVRVDLGVLRQGLVFAFAAGASQEVFDGALAGARLPASSWRRTSFARDLYLEELVDKCFAVQVEKTRYAASARYLTRVLGEPPSDPR
ncbi:MAG TPA: DNA mismatch repair protein, partial [Polyangiaceae bacterium]|nr:DNA mismatch repair protein [Polyangiaceae bacterium]